MVASFDLKNTLQENRIFLSRATICMILVCFGFIGLVSRLIYLQVTGHAHYADLSQSNRVKVSVITPIRGLIYDRNGEVLAENNPSYSLDITPEQVDDLDETIARLRQIIPLTDEEVEDFQKRRQQTKRFNSVSIRTRLNEQEVATFSVQRHQFPGVDIQANLLRHYPHGDYMAHVIGYVGRINEEELRSIDPVRYRGMQSIGKSGIERAYEDELLGEPGYQETENTAQGRSIKLLSLQAPIPGHDLTLNIDAELQQIAYEALGDYNGAVVAISPKTGAIHAFASKPGFDNNLFVQGIDVPTYKALNESHDRPLFNRALRGQYPPGSTLKPFFALAGLEYNVITQDRTYFCPGYYQLPNSEHKYRDWKKWGHGKTDMHKAIVQSCDVYHYILAHDLGIDRMHDFLHLFGFGSQTGIDLIGESSGLLPSREWKRKVHNQIWFPGETLISGIGQGYNLVTPLQLANATAILASRGMVNTPSLVATVAGQTPVDVVASSESFGIALEDETHWDDIFSAMKDVVHSLRGTAKGISKDLHYFIAGKTGTAQVFSVAQEETYKEDEIAEKLKDHALFIAFAPYDDPQLAIAVIVENGGHGGSVAAPIARAVFDAFLRPES